MNEHPPPHCGAYKTVEQWLTAQQTYLAWKIRLQQKWRDSCHVVAAAPFVPIKLDKVYKRTTPPRKGDAVLWFGEYGYIGWLTSSHVYVYFNGDQEEFDRSLFTSNYTSRGSRTTWSI